VWVTLAGPTRQPHVMGGPPRRCRRVAVPRLLVYFTGVGEVRLFGRHEVPRSDFIDARYAFSFVFANFGIASRPKCR